MTNPPELLTRDQAARILHVGLSTLDGMIARAEIPAPKPLGSSRRVHWIAEEFHAYMRHRLSSGVAVATSAAPVPKAPDMPPAPVPVGPPSPPQAVNAVRTPRTRRKGARASPNQQRLDARLQKILQEARKDAKCEAPESA